MLVLEQNFAEEWAAGTENHFVGRQLLLSLASQCHVREILVRQQTLESQAGTVLKLVPSQVEVLGVGHGEACQGEGGGVDTEAQAGTHHRHPASPAHSLEQKKIIFRKSAAFLNKGGRNSAKVDQKRFP